MKTIETVGKDIEQALLAGLAELDCKLDDVDVKILEHPGIFRKARVRMTYLGQPAKVKTAASVMRNLEERAKTAPLPDRKEKRRDKKDRNSEKQNVKAHSSAVEASADKKQFQPEKKNRPEKPSPQAGQDNAKQSVKQVKEPAPQTKAQAKQDQPKTENKQDVKPENKAVKKPEFSRDFRAELLGMSAKENAPQPARTEKKAEEKKEAKEIKSVSAEELENAKAKATAYIAELVRLMGEESEVEAKVAGSEVNVRITRECETLIGYKGETIEAMEYLANVTVPEAKTVRINLDCGEYRARRDEAIVAMANEKADKAVATGKRVELEAMTSAARKAVHATLAERSDVITRSEGKEPNRYIVIIPKQTKSNGGQKNNRPNKKHWHNKKKPTGGNGEKA
ncbi:MAG: Jag N-terminal domain-containing protein [Clostridia bacterium]|nr:Jag N-terminal domain-containing protein [Clostridia bacterium]